MTIEGRLRSLRRRFQSLGIDSFFVSCAENVSYLSGFKGMESFLFITSRRQYFLTDFRYGEQARREARGFDIALKASQSYPLILEGLRMKEGACRIGVEAGRITQAFYQALSRHVPSSALVPTQGAIESFRMVKDKEEIADIKKGVDIMARGFKYLATTLMPGMTEKEAQAKFEYYTKMIGSDKPAFDIIVAAGPRSSMPHAVSSRSPVQEDDMVLVDMGVVYNGYHTDLTRCIFLGKIPPAKRKIYDIVLGAQEAGIRKVRPGVRARDVDKACRDYIHRKGYGRYFGHGTGHGVGLEIHEAPTVSSLSEETLRPGMVITVEPGIYLPGRFGVRIEDLILVKERGHEVLTRAIDKTPPSRNNL